MCPNWRLHWIDTRIFAVGCCLAAIISGRVKKRVAMEGSDESANVGVCLRAVKTLLTNIYFSLAE